MLGRVGFGAWLLCGFGGECDGVAECFELRDESSLVGVAGAATIEVVSTEIGVDLTGREHVPDDDKDRVAGRDGSFGWSSSSTDGW